MRYIDDANEDILALAQELERLITWGPLAWVLTAEVPPNQVREKTVAISGMGAYIVGLIIMFVNPYTQAEIGGRVAFIYGGLSIVAFVFSWFFVPELSQRSLEEIKQMFEDRISTRTFKSHVFLVPADVTEKKEEVVFIENV
ncbi:hypothetical protein N8T08_002215 [Aspergillus melleus]|uniref:Uncharacterized protein n=1 Tax=Aspergillus melleus TaxID=138277 RepID=A0ACC3B8T1_9EURO|nr:hypothetical protein N8T08_002215 [Aspergillus melleus]